MFEELAKSHQRFKNLLNQEILDQLSAYHNQFFNLAPLPLPESFMNFQTKLQLRCAEIEQQWHQMQKDIEQQVDLIENQLVDLAIEKKLTSRVHWVRRLRCNYEFYHNHRNITLENESIEQIKFEIVKHLPVGYYPVALLGLDHRMPHLLKYLSSHANPFYIADIYQESFALLDQLPGKAKQRALVHLLGNEDNQVGLHNVMPHNQFGFIMAWNLFDYFTEEVIKEWLEQIVVLLRPGGRVFFTYNNCLDPTNAAFIDLTRNGFTIPSRLTVIAKEVGLEVCEFESIQSAHWAVLSKPGTFQSARATPGTGKIMIRK